MKTSDDTLEDLAARFRTSVPAAILRRVRAIATWTREDAARCALVGGPVRDLLLGAPNIDIDLAVETDVRALVRRAEREWGCEARYYDAFETATLLFEDGSKIDLARTRTETYAQPGALPDVEPASLDDDLRRRDFTINAMALVVRGDGFERLLDPFDGRSDLARRWVRMLHRASFLDDPTRIYRAARFAGRLNFRVETKTARRILSAVAAFAPASVSAARLAREMRLILSEAHPVPALWLVQQFRAERFVFPNLDRDTKPLRRLACTDAFVRRLDHAPLLDFVTMRAVALAWDWPEAAAVEWLIALGVPSSAAQRLAADAARAPEVVRELLAFPRQRRDERLLAFDGMRDEALAVVAFLSNEVVRHCVARYWEIRPLKKVQLTGDDLQAMGIRPGPGIGRALAELRRAVWRGDAGADRETQHRWMEESLKKLSQR
ncbi:MAG: CCA tRNA nucleotidyltransferase [Deltaproteobacteria bacterium]|nr:CCA tRNA nucleotidyltransferase [Deltaproteobacteria bacterium]